MAAVAARRRPLQRLAARRPSARTTAILAWAAMVLGSLFYRTTALTGPLWADEALSIGIARHPLSAVPGVLAQDGSPPLYYLLLHVWIGVFGGTEPATHALSVVIALLCIPAAFWAGRTLFDARAGWIATALLAFNPFLDYYAQETRMYSLTVLLGLVCTTAFALAFVRRRRAFVPVFSVALAMLLYTHNWGLFFMAAAGIVLLVLLRLSARRRTLLRDGVLGFGGALLLFAPWLPTLAFQAAHTGAPWTTAPSPAALASAPAFLLGSAQVCFVLLLAGALGVWELLRRPRDPDGGTVLVCLLLALVTLLVAFAASQASPAWAPRYFGVVLGPLSLLAALGLSRAGRVGLVGLVLTLAFWAPGAADSVENKANADDVAVEVDPLLRPGDLVVSTQPEQVPLLAYYLRPGLRYVSTFPTTPDPGVVDWRDALARLRASTPQRALEPQLATLPVGARVLLARPVTEVNVRWKAPWTRLVRRRSAQWGATLATDPRFQRVGVAPRFYRGAATVGLRAVVYRKRAA